MTNVMAGSSGIDDKMNINRYIYLKFNIISFRTSTTTNKECKLVVVVRGQRKLDFNKLLPSVKLYVFKSN